MYHEDFEDGLEASGDNGEVQYNNHSTVSIHGVNSGDFRVFGDEKGDTLQKTPRASLIPKQASTKKSIEIRLYF